MIKSTRARKISYKILKSLGIFIIIIGVLYLLLGFYISSHHDKIVRDLNKVAKEKFTGDIKIGDVEILFFKGFPNLTLEVKDVVVKDSLWNQHKKTFIDSKSIYVNILPWSIILTDIKINTITIENAKLDIFVDKNGYSNTSALTPRKSSKKEPKSQSMLSVEIDHVKLRNVNIISDNVIKHKRFAFDTEKLNIKIDKNKTGWNAKVTIKTLVKSLAFNTKQGSFAKDKLIDGEINVDYNKEKEQIFVHSDKLSIGETDFKVDAELGASVTNSKFGFHFSSNEIYWKEAASLVTNNISSKLNKFNFKDSFEVKADIHGDFKVVGEPSIHVVTQMKNNTFTALQQEITECSMTGEFTNDYAKNGDFGDPNSAILLHNYKGKYKDIPFVTQDMMILDLTRPIASGYVESTFEIEKLGSIINKKYLNFKKGIAKVNVKFKGDIVDLKVSKPFIIGKVAIDNSDFIYVPGNVNFTNNSIQIEFNSDKLVVKNIAIKTAKSTFKMSGYSENFMNLFYDKPEKITLNWDVSGEKIDLGGFLYLLKTFKTVKPKKSKNQTSSELVEKALHQSRAVLNLKVNQIVLHKFIGRNAVARISLLNNKIILHEASIKYGSGTYAVKGAIHNSGSRKAFAIDAMVNNCDIAHLLQSFDNFGSSTITSKTVKGTINLKSSMSGFFSKDAGLDKKSLVGNIQFTLKNGSLINFEPIQKVGKIAFHNRDFKNVTFENIYCDGTFKNRILSIEPMEIKTSVLQIDVAGDYGFAGGTNMGIDLHLRDPKKNEVANKKSVYNTNPNKGIIVRLKAIEDKSGKIKINLGSKKQKPISSINSVK